MAKRDGIGTFSGVGESAAFGGNEIGAEDSRWTSATLNGQPVPAHLVGILPWAMTDQGSEERNAGKERSRVSVTRDERDNEIGRRADQLRHMAPEDAAMASDPLRDRAKQYVGPGMTPRFLSKSRIKNEAGSTRGYEVVKDENGDAVQFGNMVLGQIPTETFIDRRAAAAVRSRQQIEVIKETQSAAELKSI